MRLSVIAALLGITLTACPHPEPRSNCAPGSMRCDNGRPYLCSPEQYWTPSSSACSGAWTCCMTQNPTSGRSVFACVPPEACIASRPDAGEAE